jgi:hypothetical protein
MARRAIHKKGGSMRVRQLVGVVLLVLTAISVGEITLDRATHHVWPRQQWRAGAQPGPQRAPQRSTPRITDNEVSLPAPGGSSAVVTSDGALLLSPVSASVFVPPRV